MDKLILRQKQYRNRRLQGSILVGFKLTYRVPTGDLGCGTGYGKTGQMSCTGQYGPFGPFFHIRATSCTCMSRPRSVYPLITQCSCQTCSYVINNCVPYNRSALSKYRKRPQIGNDNDTTQYSFDISVRPPANRQVPSQSGIDQTLSKAIMASRTLIRQL